ncbi:MAG TPA: head-tail adaptor protein [Marinobacter sp.]|uniref:Phage head-tail adaptor n=1 Tax=marine sediment metagenome TaxID=412755 RepID=A0A0F8ZUL9_9ZZZZ|nr:head-tail adaptor protein [Marinobacter sp.]
MQAGQLRHRVEVQASSEANSRGNTTKTWTTEVTIWAGIEPLSGRELIEAQEVVADATHRVKIRYLADVTPKKRFLFGTRELYIESVQNIDERNRELVLTCVERS